MPQQEGFVSLVTERNRYFTGKYMGARDFTDEQAYFVSRQRLHNHLLHGQGIVSGLAVVPHPDEACRHTWVVIQSGVALDGQGREVIVERDMAVELPADAFRGDGRVPQTLREPLMLGLRYAEDLVEHVPALYAEGTCDPRQREANRVREVARVETWPGDWPPQPPTERTLTSGPDGDVVPLARLSAAPNGTGLRIDLAGRRYLRPHLAHIDRVNWPHGGEITLAELRDGLGGRLQVHFDTPLASATPGVGVNPLTFTVHYGQPLPTQPLVFDPATPPRLVDETLAQFDFTPAQLAGPDSLAGQTIYIRLKCDFIVDRHGVAVDGAHVAGRLPSGNGMPGGDFESWFRIAPEGAAEEDHRE